MKKMLTRERMGEFFRFGVNGSLSFLIDYGFMVVFKEVLGINYLWAAGLSFCISVAFNYVLCRVWVFRSGAPQTFVALVLFFGSSLVGLGLNQLIMWLAVDLIGISYLIAKIAATALVMVWNYFAKRFALNLGPRTQTRSRD